MSTANGMNYAPKGKPKPVVKEGEFVFAALSLDHGHIYGMCNGLREAGGTLKWVYDPDPKKVEAFVRAYPEVRPAESKQQILQDAEVVLVAAAAITNLRGPLGVEVMKHGKHYFTDKAPFTTLEQLAEARKVTAATGKIYAVYYSERLHVESAEFAGQLVKDGAVGRVLNVLGLGPHRLNAAARPDWFFNKEQYGGIICDLASHQIEQFLYFAGCKDATVQSSKIANYNNKQYPELEDFGDVTMIGDNGATHYSRVDWFTPDGLSTWGDGRTIILGTEGYIELRKYVDLTRGGSDHLFLVNGGGEQKIDVKDKVGFPYFGALILDCLNGTELAMTQAHTFKAAELSLQAQLQAVRVE
ncbi:Gfo/Idh/MocA family oxidoreductase [Paenibacillus sp. FSL H8-0537]|uniref:Gfo/Idh/MocA family protein n=1 Tax=Paenibacillus sp. FSL H8-0537 TaxID=2921399 RepID=UPI003101B1CD